MDINNKGFWKAINSGIDSSVIVILVIVVVIGFLLGVVIF